MKIKDNEAGRRWRATVKRVHDAVVSRQKARDVADEASHTGVSLTQPDAVDTALKFSESGEVPTKKLS